MHIKNNNSFLHQNFWINHEVSTGQVFQQFNKKIAKNDNNTWSAYVEFQEDLEIKDASLQDRNQLLLSVTQ